MYGQHRGGQSSHAQLPTDDRDQLLPALQLVVRERGAGYVRGRSAGGREGDQGVDIIGGWCVGTVLDNAASRSTIGHQVRNAPASMALSVNVNVEWWSGADLYGSTWTASQKRRENRRLAGAQP